MAGLVQYVIVNKDIITKLGWPFSAVIAQCCHATTAVGHLYKDDDAVKTYFGDIDNMHKIGTEDELRKLSQDLTTNEIKHKLWIEQPENIATCCEKIHSKVQNVEIHRTQNNFQQSAKQQQKCHSYFADCWKLFCGRCKKRKQLCKYVKCTIIG